MDAVDLVAAPAQNALGRVLVGAGLAVLSISILGNVLLWSARDRTLQMEQERDSARAMASACSDGVDDLRDLADKRGKETKAALAKAQKATAAAAQAALSEVATPAAVPGDDYKSAVIRLQRWEEGRGPK